MNYPREPLRDITDDSLREFFDKWDQESLLPAADSAMDTDPSEAITALPTSEQSRSRQNPGFTLYSDENPLEAEKLHNEERSSSNDEPMPDFIGVETESGDEGDHRTVTNITTPPSEEAVTKNLYASTSNVRKRRANFVTIEDGGFGPVKIPKVKRYHSTGDHRNNGVDILHIASAEKRGSVLHTRFDSYPRPTNDASRAFSISNDLANNPYVESLFKDPMRMIHTTKPLREASSGNPPTISATMGSLPTPPPHRPRVRINPTSPQLHPSLGTKCPPRSATNTSPSTTCSTYIQPTTPMTPLSPSDRAFLLARHASLRAKRIAYDDALRQLGVSFTRTSRSKIAESVNRAPNLVADFRILTRSRSHDAIAHTNGHENVDPATFLEAQDKAWERALMQQLVVKKRDWLVEQARQVEKMLEADGVRVEAGVESRKGRGRASRVAEREAGAGEILRVLCAVEGML